VRVRAIFTFSSSRLQQYYSSMMVYVEEFTPFTSSVLPSNGIYLPTVSQSLIRGQRAFAILPIEAVSMACHLIPVFKRLPPTITLPHPNLLESAHSFYLNIFATHLIFAYAFHWSQQM
jgi:hypothetical protein